VYGELRGRAEERLSGPEDGGNMDSKGGSDSGSSSLGVMLR